MRNRKGRKSLVLFCCICLLFYFAAFILAQLLHLKNDYSIHSNIPSQDKSWLWKISSGILIHSYIAYMLREYINIFFEWIFTSFWCQCFGHSTIIGVWWYFIVVIFFMWKSNISAAGLKNPDNEDLCLTHRSYLICSPLPSTWSPMTQGLCNQWISVLFMIDSEYHGGEKAREIRMNTLPCGSNIGCI